MRALPAAPLLERPQVSAALERAHLAARVMTQPELLALCEQRIATLLGDSQTSRPPQTSLERAAIAFTEQWVIDVASMTDELVADLMAELGNQDELMDFIHSLLVVEQRIRLGIAWRQLA